MAGAQLHRHPGPGRASGEEAQTDPDREPSRRIVFLGAGASRKAGYPLASALLDALESEVTGTSSGNLREAWEQFNSYREGASGPAKVSLFSKNPEVVLSLLDLYEAAHQDASDSWFRELKRLARNPQADRSQFSERHPFESEPADLKNADLARKGLIDCLQYYFGRLHARDFNEESTPHREYLRGELSSLNPGDVVLTTNWDTLAERVLSEERKWHPGDGYGFPVQLEALSLGGPLPDWTQRPSSVRVLKVSV